MCGICGYVHFNRAQRASREILQGMAATLARRGPDDEGLYVAGHVALGHRRLSIIDLTTGHQPMATADGSLVIVYNGEIYNFPEIKRALEERGRRFTTHSDTEVVLQAYQEYGESCLDHFNGMFALAIWDARAGALFLARDRFGKKPLYYAIFDHQFIFGSELKALLKHPAVRREIDPTALSRYLAYEYVPAPLSIFKHIHKLPAGHKLRIVGGEASSEQYWDMPFGAARKVRVAEAKERVVSLLKESVRRRLVSDVPLGVFLSGGIDSSAVVAMMAQLMDPKEIKTFAIGFKERSFDESGDARRVARHFGTDHYEKIVDPGAMLGIFDTVVDLLDEPFADSSIIPTYLVSQFTREHVTVALGGDGGDELFLGYPSFIAHKLNGYAERLPAALTEAPLHLAARLLGTSNDYMSLNFKIRRFLRGLAYPHEVRHQAWIGAFPPDEQKGLFAESVPGAYDAVYEPTRAFYRAASSLGALDRASYVYLKTYMTDDILTKVDRASMANSLEVRAPFLDTDLAAYAFALPASYKLHGLTTKWILKEALKGILPDETLFKPKHGFAVPVAKWLKTEMRERVYAAFDKKKIEREGLFRYNYIQQLLERFMGNAHDTRREMWDLFMFELWYDRWMA